VPKDAAGNTRTGRVVTWGSSNTSIATVSGSGLVTGKAAGGATITATSEGKSGTATITVQAPPVGTHAGHYVAPTASSSGDGPSAKPCDLATAFTQPVAVPAAATVSLRARADPGAVPRALTGSSRAAPIVR